MEKEILLLGKKIFWDRSEVLLDYQPDENWQDLWDAKLGHWEYKDGCLIGTEPGNFGGILLSKQYFEDNVMMRFTMSTVLPATRDLNAVFCTTWDDSVNYLKKGYVVGLNGWYENKSGIERFPESELRALTTLYHYEPGTEVEILTGAIDGHCFLFVNGVLIQELIDKNPILGGHVGFSPYSTSLRIRDIQIRKICWEKRHQVYEPEFV
jgi:hypothetical protein